MSAENNSAAAAMPSAEMQKWSFIGKVRNHFRPEYLRTYRKNFIERHGDLLGLFGGLPSLAGVGSMLAAIILARPENPMVNGLFSGFTPTSALLLVGGFVATVAGQAWSSSYGRMLESLLDRDVNSGVLPSRYKNEVIMPAIQKVDREMEVLAQRDAALRGEHRLAVTVQHEFADAAVKRAMGLSAPVAAKPAVKPAAPAPENKA
jgi:hypothetical protein